MVMQRIVKPKTQRGKRFLQNREPKIHENTKTATFIKGGNTSETITQILKELHILKKPNSVTYKRRNILRPFEDETPLEYFAQKSDSALFMFGSHSKKRPHNIVVGRMFDYHVLDMVEFGIEKFQSMFDIKDIHLCSFSFHTLVHDWVKFFVPDRVNTALVGRASYMSQMQCLYEKLSKPHLDFRQNNAFSLTDQIVQVGSKCAVGTKPCILFAGDIFDQDGEYKRIKNLFLDFFRGTLVEQIRLAGLEHVLMITAIEGKIYIRNYRILMKKSGSRTPRIELEEMGPSLDLTVRRTKLASDDLYKRALKVPKTAKPKKTKNISQDPFGSKLGRIHMQKQDLSKLQTRKLKGLKRKRGEKVNTAKAKKSKPSETV